MNLSWHSILEKIKQNGSTSFIGGKPCIPPSNSLPVCKICGEPLTFFFQIAFPEEHIWAGKSLAFFYCSSAYQKHSAKEQFPPAIHASEKDNFLIPAGDLAPERYQTLFRAIIFNTSDGVLREDYQEKVEYQEIHWKASKKKDKHIPIILGGKPIWCKYGKETPASYDGKRMDLILQIAENFNFDKLPNASPEMEKDFMTGEFAPRAEPDYTLFYDFNRIYLWGTSDPENPAVYLSVQNDI